METGADYFTPLLPTPGLLVAAYVLACSSLHTGACITRMILHTLSVNEGPARCQSYQIRDHLPEREVGVTARTPIIVSGWKYVRCRVVVCRKARSANRWARY